MTLGGFDGLLKNPHQHSSEFTPGVEGKDLRELNGYKTYLMGGLPDGHTEETIKFVKEGSTTAQVEHGLKTLEEGFRRHACIACQMATHTNAAYCHQMIRYLDNNPIDGDKIPKTDEVCYESRKKMMTQKDAEGNDGSGGEAVRGADVCAEPDADGCRREGSAHQTARQGARFGSNLHGER